jgi:hypothetical protein
MKYDKETTDKLIDLYKSGIPVSEISEQFNVPERSVIAKLSSLGVYQRKEYKNKRGETPVKKEEYIERIAKLMMVNLDLLESLEKANKNVLALIEKSLVRP